MTPGHNKGMVTTPLRFYAQFICPVHILHFLKGGLEVNAVVNDIFFMKHLFRYNSVDRAFGDTEPAIMENGWCLTKDKVIFSLFTDSLSFMLKFRLTDQLLSFLIQSSSTLKSQTFLMSERTRLCRPDWTK